MKKLIVLFVLLTSVCVYAQTDDKTMLKELNQKLVESYKNNKLDDALKYANQAVELSLKIYGDENAETAVAYSNLGTIQRDKQKYKDSAINFQKAVDVYLKLNDLKGTELIDSYENLAISLYYNRKENDSITNYLKAIEVAKVKFGPQSKENFVLTLNLANLYARDKKFEISDEYYLKSYELAWKHFGKGAKEIEQVSDSRVCVIPFDRRTNKITEKVFQDSKNKLFEEIFGLPNLLGNNEIVNSGFIEGKALLLPPPAYPSKAKEQRLQGQVLVKVLIDENGIVIEAKSICRTGILESAAEEAAMKAKFSPTTLSGKAAKVYGIITYNFVAGNPRISTF